MQQKMIVFSFCIFEMVYGAPMSDFNPGFLFKDDLNGPSSEYLEIQTTAVPDLPEFLFKQFGEPPLTDNQILALLIGSTAIPEGLMTKAIPTEQTTTDVVADDVILQAGDVTEADDVKVEVNHVHQLEVELIEQAKEIEQRLQKDISDFKELEERRKIETVEIQIGSNAKALSSALGMVVALLVAML
jgi:hypothetical protein